MFGRTREAEVLPVESKTERLKKALAELEALDKKVRDLKWRHDINMVLYVFVNERETPFAKKYMSLVEKEYGARLKELSSQMVAEADAQLEAMHRKIKEIASE